MRVHLLGVPNTELTGDYPLDGFCQLTRRFAEVLHRLKVDTFLYGGESYDAPCTTYVKCITKAEQDQMRGDVPYQRVQFDAGHPLFLTFNTRAAAYLRDLETPPSDIIATIAGTSQFQVWQAKPELMFLEYSIGYRGVCAPYRVYQSQAWRHVVQGYTGCDGGREFDTVIPPFYHVDAYPAGVPQPYVLFCGRFDTGKGVSLACRVAEAAHLPLVLVGHGDTSAITYGEVRQGVSDQERNRLMSQAQAVLMPTRYIEPFGNVAAEAQLCGTPVIGPDIGAFTETIEQGRTGYRCATRDEYVRAVGLAATLDRGYVRRRARALWSMETAVEAYRSYFARLAQARQDGWSCVTPDSLVAV